MNKCVRSILSVAAIGLAVAGCVDDKYDLSDVDTTVGVTVEDLVIPINLDEITLGNIITLPEDGEVKLIDGKYVIMRDGTFDSDKISIPAITLKAPAINPSQTIVDLDIPLGAGEEPDVTLTEVSYDLANNGSKFRYESNFVSDFLVKIDHIGCNLTLTIDMSMQGLENRVRHVTFADVVLQLPKGLDMTRTEGGTYDAATGLLQLPDRTVDGASLHLQFEASGFDFDQADGKYDYENSLMTVDGALFIKEGRAVIAIADIKQGNVGTMPAQVILLTQYKMSDATVTTFTGSVRYNIDGSNLTDISLDNLPDVFSQHSTDLTFVNPLIYLKVTNPLQPYGVYARTGLEINAYHGKQMKSFGLDNPWFQIGPENADGVYNYCLSPTSPTDPDADFMPFTHVAFSSLRNVLSGNGIPDRLQINLTDPGMPVQRVTNLPLGRSLGSLHGAYRFVAPLQFGAGSTIIYDHTLDGWGGDDLDGLTIMRMDVSMTVSTDIPVGVKFVGYPIDKDGNRINDVNIVGADINPNADGQEVVIHITGVVRNLDGMKFEAYAVATDGEPLSPDMSLTMKNVRPRVTGFYERKL